MELTYDKLEGLIRKISLGKEYIYLNNYTFVVVSFPNNDIITKAELLYDKAYNEALKEGLLPVKELEKLIEKRGLFTSEDQIKIDNLYSKLEAQKVLLSKTLKVRANRDRIKNTITKLENEINQLLYKKYSKLSMSAESKAEDLKVKYMCWLCTHKEDNTLYWDTFESFLNDSREDLKDTILSTFNSLYRGLDITTIRYIARSAIWRVRYTNSVKTSDPLFNTPSTQYTSDQLNLVYWSNFYDQVYSMLPEDRPSDEVINDDSLLDAFMDDYYKELSNSHAIARSNKAKTKGAMSAFDAEEVIVTQFNELYEEIEYDKPREAQRIKDRVDIKKRTVSGK